MEMLFSSSSVSIPQKDGGVLEHLVQRSRGSGPGAAVQLLLLWRQMTCVYITCIGGINGLG